MNLQNALLKRLKEHGTTFKTIFSSPARRTRETITRLLPTPPSQDTQFTFDRDFYTFERDELLQAIRRLDDKMNDVIIVGHNPAMHDTLRWPTGELIAAFPTCAAAQFTLDMPRWTKIHKGSAQLNWVLLLRSGAT